jgi:IS30 family transposase
VHYSTVARELKRSVNTEGNYDYLKAQKDAQNLKKQHYQQPRKMIGALKDKVIECLQLQWSPEQIAGRLKKEGSFNISHEAIYQYVWADKHKGGKLYENLRHSGKKYNKRSGKNAGRGLIPDRVDISLRPQIVEEKIRAGDWEADTVIGAGHKGALLTQVDRFSKYTLIQLLSGKHAEPVARKTIKMLKALGLPVHSITYDNGKEFSLHKKVSKALDTQCFFARPYHSWERGLNEHTNGLIRQYLPKKTSFKNLKQKDIKFIQDRLNNRPRKVLDYKTPAEVLFADCAQPTVALTA